MKELRAEQRFEQALLDLARTYRLHDVFRDFLDYCLLMLKWWDLKPEYFAALEKKYTTREHALLFATAFYALGEIAEGDGRGFFDPFGDFYQEHLSNSHSGQFFTPQHICDLMAQLNNPSGIEDRATVGDPTCGSGRCLLAYAKLNRNALFYGADIDETCCKMTVINFLLNSMCGEVAHMDTLAMKHYKSWHTKVVLDGAGYYRPFYYETGPGDTHFIQYSNNPSTAHEPPVPTSITNKNQEVWNQQKSSKKQRQENSNPSTGQQQMTMNFE